ncbi:DUF4446 family protein [Coprothermobacter platensis]|uniref:DUF4446 family protein n=1 Tax=Coprothermobacter platensis TaxID=108819 RepID=UPI000366142E|nr:DUF4446 family protein [Coprothermobacter platensis]
MPINDVYVLYGLFGLAAILVIINIWLLVRLARIKGYEKLNAQVSEALADLDEVKNNLSSLEADEESDFSYSKVVRYDAFQDAKGRQSGSMLVLNRKGTGFIITIINSRDRSATFLKEVVEYKPVQALSPEEQVLLNEARKG